MDGCLSTLRDESRDGGEGDGEALEPRWSLEASCLGRLSDEDSESFYIGH